MAKSRKDKPTPPPKGGSSLPPPLQMEKLKDSDESQAKRNSIASTDVSSPLPSPSLSCHSPIVTYRGTAPLKSFRELHRRMVLSENTVKKSEEVMSETSKSLASTLHAPEAVAGEEEHFIAGKEELKESTQLLTRTLNGQKKADFVRPARLIRRDEGFDPTRTKLMSADIIRAKERRMPLPTIRQRDFNIINEPLTTETAQLIKTIPPRDLLQQAGVPGYPTDPMFVEEVKDYRSDYPYSRRMLHRYPKYGEFPLLLSKFQGDELSQNIVDFSEVSNIRGHNEYMMENVYFQPSHPYPHLQETFMYVPNLGRVQAVLSESKDGSTFPLVTLPKMTPRDILKVMDKQRQLEQRRWAYKWKTILSRAFCGFI